MELLARAGPVFMGRDVQLRQMPRVGKQIGKTNTCLFCDLSCPYFQPYALQLIFASDRFRVALNAGAVAVVLPDHRQRVYAA
jgi:hypothetical protein